MSYEKTNWVDRTPTNSGTPINAENMNKIEEGIAGVANTPLTAMDAVFTMPGSKWAGKFDYITLETETAAQQIMNEVARLDGERVSVDTPIHIAFVGDEIVLGEDTAIDLTEYKNLYVHGNGVKFNGNIEYAYLFRAVDCWLFDLEVKNNSSYGGGISANYSTLSNCHGNGGSGISANNSTLTNCSGSGDSEGYGIYANNSTLTNCSGSSGYGQGIYANNSTLTNCSGSSGYGQGIYAENSTLSNCSGSGGIFGTGIYAYGSCVIQGCDGTQGGISVPMGFVGMYPNTLALLQAFNKGSIIEREEGE